MKAAQPPEKYRVVQVAGKYWRYPTTPKITLTAARSAKRASEHSRPGKTFQIEVLIDGTWEAYE